MKESKEFLNLPVITTKEGNEIAMTTGFLLNADQRKAVAIAVKDDEYYKELKLIPVSQIIGVGKDALIISSPDIIISYTNIASAESLLKENISIIGTTVITSTGEIKGKVIEYSLDDDYNIVNLTVKNGDEIYDVPINNVDVLAKKHTVINLSSDIKSNETHDNKIESIASEKPSKFFREAWLKENIDSFIDGKLSQPLMNYEKGTLITEELLKDASQHASEESLNNFQLYVE